MPSTTPSTGLPPQHPIPLIVRERSARRALIFSALTVAFLTVLMGGAVSPVHAAPAPMAPGAAVPQLTVDGRGLEKSIQPQGVFTVAVNAPSGATVKFKMDGRYLGQDKTFPYALPVEAASGSHKLEARWTADGREVATASFVVRGGTEPAPAPDKEQAAAPVSGGSVASAGVVTVGTSNELAAALKGARPGQTIQLRDGQYVGKFVASASGTASAPITVTGSRAAVLTTGSVGSGYGLHVTGSQWRLTGFSVAQSAKGIVLDGSKGTIISGMDVGNVGAEAVHFRKDSSDSVIQNSVIHDTGLTNPGYGEGIYVGSAKSNWAAIMGSSTRADKSDRVVIRNNRIANTTAEGIDVKEGTTGGSILGNVFSNAGYSGANYADSWVDMKGNGYRVEGNSGSSTKLDAFQVHTVMSGWGRNNAFANNTVLSGVPGYEVWVQTGSLGTTVKCKASGAAKGLTNIRCLS